MGAMGGPLSSLPCEQNMASTRQEVIPTDSESANLDLGFFRLQN